GPSTGSTHQAESLETRPTPAGAVWRIRTWRHARTRCRAARPCRYRVNARPCGADPVENDLRDRFGFGCAPEVVLEADRAGERWVTVLFPCRHRAVLVTVARCHAWFSPPSPPPDSPRCGPPESPPTSSCPAWTRTRSSRTPPTGSATSTPPTPCS